MNAYDLASYLETCHHTEPAIFKICAKELRAQHDKIADQQTTVKFLEEEVKALRKQLIAACNELMEVKR